MKVVRLTKRDGRVETDIDLGYLFSTLQNGTYSLTLKRASDKRTIPQNKLLHMWMACIEKETGTPKEDVYMFYCMKFLAKPVSVQGRLQIGCETSSMLTKERMSEFLEKIQADAMTEMGIRLPDPQDVYFDYFAAEYG